MLSFMIMEIISDLERKINELMEKVVQSKEEIDYLHNEINEKNGYIHDLEENHGTICEELASLKNNSDEKDGRLQEAAERIRSIVNRIDSTNT